MRTLKQKRNKFPRQHKDFPLRECLDEVVFSSPLHLDNIQKLKEQYVYDRFKNTDSGQNLLSPGVKTTLKEFLLS